MQKSKVYFTDMRANAETSLLKKLDRLMKHAGFEDINFDKQYAAIKIHFGEPGNLAYIRPNYARVVADYVKRLGGKPFLTDCSTLYTGGRKNALDHLDSAYLNGYSPLSTDCHILIGDGLKGTDELLADVPNGVHFTKARIGRAVMDADVFISLNHLKGHMSTGFGGALKNIGMGCGSRAGKMEMHNSGKPFVTTQKCIACGKCLKVCAHSAIDINEAADIDHNRCVGCGHCIGACPTDAIRTNWDESNHILCEKIAEYAAAVVHGRPAFHINLVMDISPNCDCHSGNDVPIVHDVGIFASFDPVALDLAGVNAVNAQTPIKNSVLNKVHCNNKDHFTAIAPTTNWHWIIEHAEKLGVGRTDYELITV